MAIVAAEPSGRPYTGPVHAVLVALLVVPWLWPFASGPTPSVLPRLVAVACGALFVLLYLATRRERWDTLLAQALLVASVASGVIGLLQFLGASPTLAPWVNVTAPGLAFGNLRQRNQLGSLLNIGLAVIVWSAWTRPLRGAAPATADGGARAGRGSGLPHGLVMLAVIVLAAANAATASRTGLLQIAVLLALALLWRRPAAPGAWPILLCAVAAYALASALLPLLAGLDPFGAGIAARFSEGGQNCESRLILWHNVAQLIAQKPWFGWGWGELDYAHFTAVYPGARFCAILDNAHNLPLHLAVELGLPFALLVCGTIAWLVLRARPWRETDTDRRMAWAVLAMIGLHSLLEYPLWYGPFQITAVLAIGILWRRRPTPAGPQPLAAPGLAVGSRLVAAGAVLALAASAYAAWDYQRVSQIYTAPAKRAAAYRIDPLRSVQDSVLFRSQVRFAALTLATVTPENAPELNRMAHELLHFSPEARVVEKLIDSALVLGRGEEAAYFALRYRNAYPVEFARWQQRSGEINLPARTP